MQVSDAVVGAKVQMLDGNEYTISGVREPNAANFTELTLDTKSGVSVKGDTRQLVLISLPDDTEEKIEERKQQREKEAAEKQENLEKKAEKAGVDVDLVRNNRNLARAASQGNQRAVNQMLAGDAETYSGGIIHPAYAGVPAGDALRRDNTVYPTDNSPGDSPEREPAAPSANPNDLDVLDDDNGRKTIAGTPSQRLAKTPVPGTTSSDSRGPTTSFSTQSDDAALLERQRTTGVSGTDDTGMKNLLERMKTQKETDEKGQMTDQEKREATRKEMEERTKAAESNRTLLTEEQKNEPR